MTCKDHIVCQCELHEKIRVMKEVIAIGLDFADQVEDQVACPPAEMDSFREAARKALNMPSNTEPKRENRWGSLGEELEDELK